MYSFLEDLYQKYNNRCYVHPDPIEFLYGYDNPDDAEVVAFIASALAYGRVFQILKSVSVFISVTGKSPAAFLKELSRDEIKGLFKGFRHRFADEENLTALLWGIKSVRQNFGSLYECFLSGMGKRDVTVLPAMERFVSQILNSSGGNPGHLLPLPEKGSACKRLNLFLRWMVRKDRVDPGTWTKIPSSALIVPLDVHMHRICSHLQITNRKQADMRTAIDITDKFRSLSPEDPVKYDFALTRHGIRPDLDPLELINSFHRLYGIGKGVAP